MTKSKFFPSTNQSRRQKGQLESKNTVYESHYIKRHKL